VYFCAYWLQGGTEELDFIGGSLARNCTSEFCRLFLLLLLFGSGSSAVGKYNRHLETNDEL
jgi:hypothetical protein